DIPIPEYLETTLKKSYYGEDIVMCWSSKNILICNQHTINETMAYYESKGWLAYRIDDIDFEKIKTELK
ncbi:MAG: hypothetical protein K2J79_03895, partial [Ruminiclostridium sp.]|nr:hypothetical protein [Ruminiclostridium sp.]